MRMSSSVGIAGRSSSGTERPTSPDAATPTASSSPAASGRPSWPPRAPSAYVERLPSIIGAASHDEVHPRCAPDAAEREYVLPLHREGGPGRSRTGAVRAPAVPGARRLGAHAAPIRAVISPSHLSSDPVWNSPAENHSSLSSAARNGPVVSTSSTSSSPSARRARASTGERGCAVFSPNDDLPQQGVVKKRHLAARLHPRVHPHPRPGGQVDPSRWPSGEATLDSGPMRGTRAIHNLQAARQPLFGKRLCQRIRLDQPDEPERPVGYACNYA